MPLDEFGELLERLQALPFQLRFPVVKELPGPRFALIVPQLTERLFEQVGSVQASVGRQQTLQVLGGASPLKFSALDSSAYFCPLMKVLDSPVSRAYSCLRTVSSALPR